MSDRPSRRRSPIWLAFTIDPLETGKAICNICKTAVRRGGSGKDGCTTNLWNHAKINHPDFCRKLELRSGRKKQMRLNSRKKSPDTATFVLCPDSAADVPPNRATRIQKKLDGFTGEIMKLFELPDENSTMAKCLDCGEMVFCGLGGDEPRGLKTHTKQKHPGSFWMASQKNMPERKPTQEETILKLKKPMSIWNDFDKDPTNPCQAICRTCNTVVKRGSSAEHLNTTNLHKHLQSAFHLQIIRHQNKTIIPMGRNKISSLEPQTFEYKVDPRPHSLVTSSVNDIPPLRRIQRKSTENQQAFGELSPPLPNSSRNMQQNDGNENVVRLGQMDVMHTALIMKKLYDQQKKDVCCDFSIHLPVETIPYEYQDSKVHVFDEDNNVKYYITASGYEFKLHSCILSAISDKMKTMIESGGVDISIDGVSRESMMHFIEIVYSGKLSGLGSIKKPMLKEIYKIAQTLSTSVVLNYLIREYPKFSFESNAYASKTSDFEQVLELLNGSRLDTSVDQFSTSPLEEESQVNSNFKSHQTSVENQESKSIGRVNKRKNYQPKFSRAQKIQKMDALLNIDFISDDSSVGVCNDNNYSNSVTRKSVKLELNTGGYSEENAASELMKVFPELFGNQHNLFVDKSDKSMQVDWPIQSESSDSISSCEAVMKSKEKDLFFESIKSLRTVLEFSHIRNDTTPLALDTTTRKKLDQSLVTVKEELKEVYYTLATVSHRCWALFLELGNMAHGNNALETWGWVVGMPESTVYCHLLVLCRNSYETAKEKLLKHGFLLNQVETLDLPIAFCDKKVQTEVVERSDKG